MEPEAMNRVSPRKIPLPERELRRGYLEERQTAKGLAIRYGVSKKTVLRRLAHLGVPMRDRSECHKGLNTGDTNPNWSGGHPTMGRGYIGTTDPSNLRATGPCGYIQEHVRIVECALGHPLPRKHPIHHFDGNPANNSNPNLVVCESQGYHCLLHVRTRVLRAGGNPNKDKLCGACKEVKPRSEFRIDKTHACGLRSICKHCLSQRERMRRAGGKRRLTP